MAITKSWNLPKGSRKKADPSSWLASYPNPADLNFNYRKLLDNTSSSGIANISNPDFSVAIVGAGIAGLTAARELLRCGARNISLFEATERYGGRHYTKPISPLNQEDMQYTVQEGGAMRMPFFLSEDERSPEDGCSILAHYLKEFDIATEGFPNPGSPYASTGIFYNQGYASGSSEPTMLMWTKGETQPPTKDLQDVFNKWNDFISRVTTVVKQKYPTTGWPDFWKSIVRNYWNKTFRDVVLEPPKDYSDSDPGNWGGVGMTEDEATLFYIIGAGDGSWGAFFNLSFLYAYRTFVHGFSDNLQLIQGLFDSSGQFKPGPYFGTEPIFDTLGNQIPNPAYLGVKCFDDCLLFQPVKIPGIEDAYSLYDVAQGKVDGYRVNLYFNSSVKAIQKNSTPEGERISVNAEGIVGTSSFSSVITTIPTWQYYTEVQVIGFDRDAEWPFNLQTYLKRAHWEPCAKIFVGLTEAYWEQDDCKIPQCIATDSFLQDVYGVKVSRGGTEQSGTLLLSYTWWRDANKLVCYDDEDLVKLAISEADRICLGSSNVGQSISQFINSDGGYVIHWEKMPSYRGAARLYDESEWKDTQVPMEYNQEFSQKSQIYFAGESYGVDAGWTEPAMRSAIDAVLYLCWNNGFEFNDSTFQFDTDYPKYDVSFDPANP